MGANTKPRPESWNRTTPREIVSMAEGFGLMAESGIALRRRSLLAEVRGWEQIVMDCLTGESVEFSAAMLTQAQANLIEFDVAVTEFKSRPVRVEPEKRFSDERIEEAKAYPIEQLIEFDRTGKALAWCHTDRTPSLTWYRAGNRARCFPCGKSFNPIQVLMDRDGKTFVEAVKELT